MLALVLAVSLAASPEPEPIKLASLGFTQVNLKDELARFFAEHFAVQLASKSGVRVITSTDISAIVGVERQKQLLGCADSSASCMAELAGALGADGLITGQVAKVGKSYQLNIKILDSSARPLFIHSKRLASEEEVLEELNVAADRVVAKMTEALGRKPKVEATVEPPKVEPRLEQPAPVEKQIVLVEGPVVIQQERPLKPLIPVIAGGAIALVSVPLFLSANSDLARLQNWQSPTKLEFTEAVGHRDNGQLKQTLGFAALGVGVAAIGGGIAWYFLGDGPQPTAVLTPEGGAVGVAGTLP